MISAFELYKKKAIPIQFAAKVLRLGTIGKNHIQSRFNLSEESALFFALNPILSLGIIEDFYLQTFFIVSVLILNAFTLRKMEEFLII